LLREVQEASGTRGIGSSAAGGGALSERLDQAQLRDGIAKVKDRVKACGESSPRGAGEGRARRRPMARSRR
jgi:hypothetical protein